MLADGGGGWPGGQRERELILLWGKWLDWPADQVEALCAGFDVPSGAPVRRGSAYQDALSLLGVNANSEPAAIKRAYRRLISQNHPDKLAGAGPARSGCARPPRRPASCTTPTA